MKEEELGKKYLLNLAILTAIGAILWIGFDVYRALSQTTIAPLIKKQIEPLDPNIDKNTLESLQQRKKIVQEQLDSVPEITGFSPTSEAATAAARPAVEATEHAEPTAQ